MDGMVFGMNNLYLDFIANNPKSGRERFVYEFHYNGKRNKIHVAGFHRARRFAKVSGLNPVWKEMVA